ncbi:hypothetical protein NESM_000158100 [Novymonas esmeraldas]|uniref:C3H1-type domain-containing protein n=1 Tax=Novymonas esmeraldas TaxID=1808958 RepID=A0AAW0F346_9TRYP
MSSLPDAVPSWPLLSDKLSRIPAIPLLAIKHPDVSRPTPSPAMPPERGPSEGRRRAGAMTNSVEASRHGEGHDGSHASTAASGPWQQYGAVAVAPWTPPPPPPKQHNNTDSCECPMCSLTLYISYVYRDQRRASPHVMAARPSPEYATALDGSLPPLPPLSVPNKMEVCPVHAAFGFCPFHSGCFLPHDERRSAGPRVARLVSAEAEVARLAERAEVLQCSEVWSCEVCGCGGVDEFCETLLGTEHQFRQCPSCSFMCYFPHITYLVEHILASVGDDYQLYKTEVDRYRCQLPDLFKIPLTFEAHRVASIVFAWSLVSPAQARDAMNAVVRALPDVESIVSIGSGAGYIEHVFNRVMHPVPLREEWAVDRWRFPSTSFDHVRCDFFGKRVIPLFAFDSLALRGTYSVHVSMGGPISLYSLRCRHAVLLLCWPPFGSREREESSMGFEALEYFTREGGTMLIYVGDTAATGDWRFHMLLKTHYRLVQDYPVRREVRRWCPQEMGFVYGGNDTIGVYRLRETPLQLAGFS